MLKRVPIVLGLILTAVLLLDDDDGDDPPAVFLGSVVASIGGGGLEDEGKTQKTAQARITEDIDTVAPKGFANLARKKYGVSPAFLAYVLLNDFFADPPDKLDLESDESLEDFFF
jgi:hypothetical protein